MTRKSMLCGGLAVICALAALTAQAQEQVSKLAERWTQAYNSHNRAAISSLYTEDARLYAHGSPTVGGRKAIESYWAEDFKEGNPLTVLSVTNHVEGIDMVLVHGNYQVIDRKDGRLMGSGRFAHIWVKDSAGAWYLDRDLWNQPVGKLTE